MRERHKTNSTNGDNHIEKNIHMSSSSDFDINTTEMVITEQQNNLNNKKEEIPENLLKSITCSLTLQIYKEPVLVQESGRTYEREAIEKYIDNQYGIIKDPIDKTNIIRSKPILNRQMVDVIDAILNIYPELKSEQYVLAEKPSASDQNIPKLPENVISQNYEGLSTFSRFIRPATLIRPEEINYPATALNARSDVRIGNQQNYETLSSEEEMRLQDLQSHISRRRLTLEEPIRMIDALVEEEAIDETSSLWQELREVFVSSLKYINRCSFIFVSFLIDYTVDLVCIYFDHEREPRNIRIQRIYARAENPDGGEGLPARLTNLAQGELERLFPREVIYENADDGDLVGPMRPR